MTQACTHSFLRAGLCFLRTPAGLGASCARALSGRCPCWLAARPGVWASFHLRHPHLSSRCLWPLVMVRAPVRGSECGARGGKTVFAYLPTCFLAVRDCDSTILHFRILILRKNSNIREYRFPSFHNWIIWYSWDSRSLCLLFPKAGAKEGHGSFLQAVRKWACLEDTQTAGGSWLGALRGKEL